MILGFRLPEAFFLSYYRSMANTNNLVRANLFGDINDVWSLAQTEELIAMTEGEDMELLINSPGGDVFTGMAIASLLARRKGNTTTTAIGLAASIASIILLAGDKVQMDERAFLMIHDAWAFSAGDASELRKDARLLEKISNQLAELYTGKIKASGKLINGNEEETREKVRRMMKAETWLTAKEALDMGLIDEIVNGGEYTEQPDINLPGQQQTDEKELKAGVYNRLKNYKNTPNQILNKYQMQEDKKTLWQAIKAFFGAEIKAEAEAMQQPQPEPAEKEPEVKPEPTQKKEMTKEEMIAALAAEGYEVEKKPEPVAEKDPVAEMQAQIKALQDELRASKIKAAAQPAGGTEPKAKKEKTVWTEDRWTVFNGLAELAKTHRR